MSFINNPERYDINRGVELMLRKSGGDKKTKLEMKKFNFEKVFSFFRKEIQLKIELKVINQNSISEKNQC
jgi:hypothetical protein